MALQIGGVKENTNFKFLELRKLRIAKSSEAINGIASSENYQLIFAASDKSLKVISYESLFNFEWSKNAINQVIDAPTLTIIPAPFNPSFISVSRAAQQVLILSGTDANGYLHLVFYDVAKLAMGGVKGFSVLTIKQNANVLKSITSIEWHPEHGDSLFIASISDGTILTVGVNVQAGSAILTTLVSNATYVSWSPKGKQLVVGQQDGMIVFYKHNNGVGLAEAKRIAPPNNLKGYKVSSLKWIQSSALIVTYVNPSDEADPQTQYVLVSTPPKQMPTYHGYPVMCMNLATYSPSHNYRSECVPLGNIIICSSSHSSEVGVIGCDVNADQAAPGSWCKYDLDDNARIELPMSGGEDSYPRGFSFSKVTPKQYTVSETETYGGEAVPCLFVLVSTGIICPYLVIDRQSGVRFPPELPNSQLQFTAQVHNLHQSVNVPQVAGDSQVPAAPKPIIAGIGSPFQPVTQSTPALIKPVPIQADPREISKNLFGMANAERPPPPVYEDISPPRSVQQTPVAPTGRVEEPPVTGTKHKQSEIDNDTFLQAVREEVSSFNKQLFESKNRFKQVLNMNLGDISKLVKLNQDITELKVIVDAAAVSMEDLNEDTDLLTGYVIETFGAAEDARTRIDQHTDPRYRELLRKRALNPSAAAKLREIRKLKNYVESQLVEANQVLDQEWNEHVQKKKEKSKSVIESSSESPIALVYQTLSSNHKTMSLLRQQIYQLETIAGVEHTSGNFSAADISLNSTFDRSKSPRNPDPAVNSILDQMRKTTINDSPQSQLNRSRSEQSQYVRVKPLPIEKLQRIQMQLEQITKVPVRKAYMPADITKSRLISAVVKANVKFENKSNSPVKTTHTPQPISTVNQQVKLVSQEPRPTISNKLPFQPVPSSESTFKPMTAPQPITATPVLPKYAPPSMPTFTQHTTMPTVIKPIARQPEFLSQTKPHSTLSTTDNSEIAKLLSSSSICSPSLIPKTIPVSVPTATVSQPLKSVDQQSTTLPGKPLFQPVAPIPASKISFKPMTAQQPVPETTIAPKSSQQSTPAVIKPIATQPEPLKNEPEPTNQSASANQEIVNLMSSSSIGSLLSSSPKTTEPTNAVSFAAPAVSKIAASSVATPPRTSQVNRTSATSPLTFDSLSTQQTQSIIKPIATQPQVEKAQQASPSPSLTSPFSAQNVFGGGGTGGSTFGSIASGKSVFGGSPATPFGSPSPGSQTTATAFGTQQTSFAAQPAFGSAPSFAAPAFGSASAFSPAPSFGSSPSFASPPGGFGSSPSFGASPLGISQQQSTFGSGATFGSMAGQPTFGALATNVPQSSFGTSSVFGSGAGASTFGGGGSGGSTFGSAPGGQSLFGGSASGTTGFGDISSSGGASPPQFNSSSFTQRRM